MKNMEYWFALFAISQAALVIGLLLFILFYYLPKTRNSLKEKVRWYIVSAVTSYILLTIATAKTCVFGFYDWGDVWYWMVTLGYIIGDFSIIVVFREAVKNTTLNKKMEEEIKSK